MPNHIILFMHSRLSFYSSLNFLASFLSDTAFLSFSRFSIDRSVIISKGPNKGEWISSWAELFITYKTGETVTIWANTAYKVENDKIVKSYTFYNEADALEQLGYVFINPDDL